MKISVVLSSYNGEKYIEEQLNSLYFQILKPDEILIIDDCSTDNTVNIIENFIKKNNLDNWILIKNDKNLGWKKNFIEGFKKATGNLIFPCDQDDIWHRDKIQKMTQIMMQRKEILLLVSNYTPLYEKNAIKISKNKLKSFTNTEKVNNVEFNEKFMHVMRPGCVFAFKKELLDYIFQINSGKFAHDAILWRVASLLDGLYIYDYSTIDFRRHNNNASDKRVNNIDKRLHLISDNFIPITEKLIKFVEVNDIENRDKKLKILNSYLDMYKKEEMLFKKKNILLWFKLIPLYKYFYSKKSMLRDLNIIFKGK